MNTQTANKTDNTQPETFAGLRIVGTNAFNNEVLSHYLTSKTDMECCAIKPSALPTLSDSTGTKKTIVFMDCASMGKLKACETATVKKLMNNRRLLFICYNVNPEANLEDAALRKKIRGLLYTHQGIDIYPRAVQAVLDGELWYPRRILETHFLSGDSGSLATVEKTSILTQRESEILKMLGAGIKNQDIAKKLSSVPTR